MCPLECNRTEYKAIISFNELSGDHYMDILKERNALLGDFINEAEISSEIARQSFIAVSVYYDSLSFTVSSESPKMDWVGLLASIGGNLGLFLGVSVFSLCEIVECLIEIYFIKLANKITSN